MKFIEQAKLGQGNVGTYILTISIVLFSLVLGSITSEFLATNILGFSMQHIPKNVDLNALLTIILIPFIYVLISLVLCVKYLHKRAIRSIFTKRESFDWKRFFVAFGIWGAILILFLALSLATNNNVWWNFDSKTFFPLVLISLFIIPVQTSAEEAFFRGYLFQACGALFKKGWISILIISVLFGLLHGSNPEIREIGYGLIVFYISSGLFLGIMAHMDDGLELGMGYHAANNIFASLVVTNDWQAFQTNALFIDRSEPVFGWELIFILLFIQPLLLFLFANLLRWSSWKNKLFG